MGSMYAKDAPSVRGRLARRTSYPDLSPVAPPKPKPPAQVPLFIVIDGETHTLRELAHVESARIVGVTGPDGRMAIAIDCRTWHECDCPGWARSGSRGNCKHLKALVAAGVFPPILGYAPELSRSPAPVALGDGPEGGDN